VKKKLIALAEDVLAGRTDRARAAVAGQIYAQVLRAFEAERKIKEQDEVLERIANLEQARNTNQARVGPGGSHRWTQ